MGSSNGKHEKSGISLVDIVPLDFDHDFLIGYLAGQRTVHLNAYLDPFAIRNVAERRFTELSGSMRLSLIQFRKGFRRGYIDERAGLAHPLPPTDVAYQPNEMDW